MAACSGAGAAAGAVALRRRGASVGAGGRNNRPKVWTAGAFAGSGAGAWSTCAGTSCTDATSSGAATAFLAVLRGARLAVLRTGAAVTSVVAALTSVGASVTTVGATSAACCGALAFLVALRGARLAAAFFVGAAVSAGTSGAVPLLKMLSSFGAIWDVFPSSTWRGPHPGQLALIAAWCAVRFVSRAGCGRDGSRIATSWGSRFLARHRLRCRRRPSRQPMDRSPSRLQCPAAPAPAESPGVVSAA